jgi:hypothetical protein
MGDWGYAEQRLFSLTIETARSFIPAASAVPVICAANLPGALMFIDRIESAVVTGHIVDSLGMPLQANVRVEEIDSASGMTPVNPVVSDTAFGRYWRLLLPGTYTFTFTKDGYVPKTVTEVVVTDSTQTVLDVTLDVHKPCAPEDLLVTLERDIMQLSWTPVTHLTNGDSCSTIIYHVYESDSPSGPWTLLETTRNAHYEMGLPDGELHFYRVTAE